VEIAFPQTENLVLKIVTATSVEMLLMMSVELVITTLQMTVYKIVTEIGVVLLFMTNVEIVEVITHLAQDVWMLMLVTMTLQLQSKVESILPVEL
jgi:hypothetical protein